MNRLRGARAISSVAALSAIVATLAHFTADAARAAEEKFVFALPNVINASLSPLSFAEELGYFKAEGLVVDTPVLVGSGVLIPQLLNGSIHSTYSAFEPLVISKKEGGANFPFRFGYNFLRKSVWELAVLESSPIKDVAGLAGKTVGVGGMTWGNVPGTRAILKAAGIPSGQITLAAIGDGTPALEALRRGDVAATNLYDTKHIQFEQAGVKLRRLPLPPKFSGISSHGMPFTERVIASRPDLIGRFGRAFTKGIVACQVAIENCLRAFWKRNPDHKPQNAEAALPNELMLLQARLDSMLSFRPDEPKLYGAFTDKDWLPMIEALKDAEQIPATLNLPLETLYTNQFVSEFNKFDLATVAKEAKEYRP